MLKGLVLAAGWLPLFVTLCIIYEVLAICKYLPVDCLAWHGSMHLVNQKLIRFLVL